MTRLVRRVGAVLALQLLAACGVFGHTSTPRPETDLAATLAQADREVLATRFGIADKLLSDFAAQHPATAEGSEASFWRALYKLDPANQTASPHDALVLLDAYLASSLTTPHRAAATTLRHIAATFERGPAVVTQTVTVPGAPAGAKSDDKSKDDEVARLKEELAKANAELERIKRRVATPAKP